MIWAHMSIAGGVNNAFERSDQIGGNILQIFGKSPRGRKFAKDKVDQDDIQKAREAKKEYDQRWWVIHSVYLINLAKSYENAKKSIDSVLDDFWLADQLGLDAVNTHLGKYTDLSKQEGVDNMISNMEYILDDIKDRDVKFLFENTSGQWTEIGWDFSELGKFYDSLKNEYGTDIVQENIGFCIDTAHWRGAGYDWNNFDQVIDEFDEYIGTNKIDLIHLNDTKAIVGSRLDRHASLGYGFIGLPNIAKVINWSNSHDIPVILETPNQDKWPEEIDMIKKISSGEFDEKDIQDFHSKHFRSQYLKKFEKQAKGETLFE